VTDYLPGIFALIVLAAGWYYIFYSPAARRLSGIETDRANRLRTTLRRTNGVIVMLLAVAFYALVYTVQTPQAFLMVLVSAILLIGGMVTLGLIDMRLTAKLIRDRRSGADFRRGNIRDDDNNNDDNGDTDQGR
jgi:hypothetical protein